MNKWIIEIYQNQCTIQELWEFIEDNLKVRDVIYPAYWVTERQIEKAKEKNKILLAMKGKIMVGCLMLGKGEIEILCVKRRHRKKGIGKSLVEAAEKELKKRRSKVVRVYSLKQFMAREFYEKLGYEVEYERQNPYDRTWHLKKEFKK